MKIIICGRANNFLMSQKWMNPPEKFLTANASIHRNLFQQMGHLTIIMLTIWSRDIYDLFIDLWIIWKH